MSDEKEAVTGPYVNMSRNLWWYAVQVKYEWEFVLAEALLKQHAIYGTYCPSYKKLKKESRHKKARPEVEIEAPLFPKWIFVRFHGLWRPWEQVLNFHRHIEGFLSIGGEPIPIRDWEIATLRRECEAGVYHEKGLEGGIVVGDRVEIRFDGHNGWSPFIGHKGDFVERLGDKTKIEIMIFGRATEVVVPASMIEKIF